MKDYDSWKLQNDRDENPYSEPEPDNAHLEPVAVCQHCNRWVFEGDDYEVCEGHSGPSVHYIHFHKACWKCPKCGTCGPHYCPADIARD